MTDTAKIDGALMRTFIRRTVVSLAFVGALLFGAAGTLNWPEAWLYLAYAALLSFGAGVWMARNDPALLAERLRSPFQREQEPWDKAVMAAMLAFWIFWLILVGLDHRYRWSDVPLTLKGIGLALIVLGSYLVMLTLKANSYAAPVVKIQKGRGHAWQPPGLTPMSGTRCMPGRCCSSRACPFSLARGGGLRQARSLFLSSPCGRYWRRGRSPPSSTAMPAMPRASATVLFRIYGNA